MLVAVIAAVGQAAVAVVAAVLLIFTAQERRRQNQAKRNRYIDARAALEIGRQSTGMSDGGEAQIDWVEEASMESFPASDAPAWPEPAGPPDREQVEPGVQGEPAG